MSVSPDETPQQPYQDAGLGGATQIPRHKLLDIMHRNGYTPAQTQEVQALLPEQVDSHEDRVILEKYGLDSAARMERGGSSP